MADEIQKGQERLGAALRDARRGEPTADLSRTIRETGLQLVNSLTGLMRMTRVHALDNDAFKKPIEDFAEVLGTLIDAAGPIHVIAVEDQTYINDVRIRLDPSRAEGIPLSELLGRHGLGGVSFHARLGFDELTDFLVAYSGRPDPDAPRIRLHEALRVAGLQTIDVAGPFRFRILGERTAEDDEAADQRRAGVVDEAWQNLGAGRVPNALPVRRLVTEMLKAGVTADGLWRELGDASPECAHCIRVALVSLIIGDAAGLNERTVQDLGVAAIFHDIGYARREGAERGSGLRAAVAGTAPPYERHARAGARILMRQQGFRDEKVRRILAVIEHHRDYDDKRGKPSLFARVIRIAEDYDNLVRQGGGWLAPNEAIERMAGFAGTRYDPVLFQLFVNRMGRYPPGTVVKLADGSQVRSVSLVRSPETWDRPLCYRYRNPDGTWPRERTMVDLADGGEVESAVEI